MTSIAHGGRGVARWPLPRWGAAFSAAFLGWVLTLFGVGSISLAAWELGLLGRPAGHGLRDWPYADAGWSSLAANAVVWFWLFAATALVVRGLLADRSYGTPVSAASVFVVLLITGFAPFVPRGLLELPWLGGLILTAALLRVAPKFGPAPLRKETTAKLAASATVLLVIPAAHAVVHPLWPSFAFAIDPMPRNEVMLSLRNQSHARVELQRVSLETTAPVELTSVRVGKSPPFTERDRRRLPAELDPRSDVYVAVRFRNQTCGTGSLPAEAALRYEVFGLRRTEAVPVRIPLRAC